MPVPGRTPRHGAEYRSVRLRLGAVLQQPVLPVQLRERGEPEQCLEQVDNERTGRADISWAAGSPGGSRERIHCAGRSEVASAAGGAGGGQVRRDNAVE